MNSGRQAQRGVNTTTTIDLAGRHGLDSLGPAVQTENVDEFGVRGTQWGFGRTTIADLTLTSFEHDAETGSRLAFVRPGSVSLVFVLEGMAQVEVGGCTFFFIPGSAAVLPTGSVPQVVFRGPTRLLIVTARTRGDEFMGMLPERPSAISSTIVRTQPAAPFYLALANTARVHPIRTEPTSTIIMRLMAGLLTADQDWHTRPDRPAITHVLGLIAEHHTDAGFDRRMLAKQNRTSARALDALLREQAGGKSADELITERRLISAMPLLRPGNAPAVEQIAERCGFPSPEAFETLVERVYGVNASALLASHQPIVEELPEAQDDSGALRESVR